MTRQAREMGEDSGVESGKCVVRKVSKLQVSVKLVNAQPEYGENVG